MTPPTLSITYEDGTALGTVQETMKQSERVEILKRAFPGIDGVSPESARKLNESTQILSDLIERTADMQEED